VPTLQGRSPEFKPQSHSQPPKQDIFFSIWNDKLFSQGWVALKKRMVEEKACLDNSNYISLVR
jgi:hypothetical protein